MNKLLPFLVGVGILFSPSHHSEPLHRDLVSVDTAGPHLLVRSDDMEYTHRARVANERVIHSGLPLNVSAIFAAPWYQEAVEILKQFSDASVGAHLCANSERNYYKWDPVADRHFASSIVGPGGYFYYDTYQTLDVERTPEVDDLETTRFMSAQRQIERDLLLDLAARGALAEHRVELVTYRGLWEAALSE